MPARNTVKLYLEDSYYHIYNRGVEKRVIFQDSQDYGVFLSYLKDYLLPKDEPELRKRLSNPNISYTEKDKIIKLLRLNNFADEITLIAYCLMSNHFHFLIKQKGNYSIHKLMQSLSTRYTMYFNQKYKRVGSLCQAVYKAVLVASDEQLLHLTRYIHKQALASKGETLQEQPCSYLEYVGKQKTGWVKPNEILAFFSKTNPSLTYKAFVKQEDNLSIIHRLVIED